MLKIERWVPALTENMTVKFEAWAASRMGLETVIELYLEELSYSQSILCKMSTPSKYL